MSKQSNSLKNLDLDNTQPVEEALSTDEQMFALLNDNPIDTGSFEIGKLILSLIRNHRQYLGSLMRIFSSP